MGIKSPFLFIPVRVHPRIPRPNFFSSLSGSIWVICGFFSCYLTLTTTTV